MNKCEKWLYGNLHGQGEVLCDDIRSAAKQEGFTRADLKSARKALNVKTLHQFDGEGATQNWFWYLEEQT